MRFPKNIVELASYISEAEVYAHCVGELLMIELRAYGLPAIGQHYDASGQHSFLSRGCLLTEFIMGIRSDGPTFYSAPNIKIEGKPLEAIS